MDAPATARRWPAAVALVLFTASCSVQEPSHVHGAASAQSLREARGVVDDDRIREASGLVASRQHRGVLWVHNDSGDNARLFALSTRAKVLGTFYLKDVRARDWEDIAIGPGPEADRHYLYVGDIGDNALRRQHITVYRIPEPDIHPEQPPAEHVLEGVERLKFTYPDGPHNSETLMIDPVSGDLLVVTKSLGRHRLYRAAAPLRPDTTTMLAYEGALQLPPSGGLLQLTVAGDLSPTGRWALIKTYDAVYRWKTGPNGIFEGVPSAMPYVPEPQGEALAWAVDESGYFTLSEEAGGVPAVLYYYPLTRRDGQVHPAGLQH